MNARTSNWETEEAFFRAMWEWLHSNYTFPDMPTSADPITELERQKAERPAEAGKSLREAVRDLIEMTGKRSGAELDAIDRNLKERGTPNLTAFRLQQKRFLKRLLKHGRISRVEEYRFLISLLSDGGETGLADVERAAVGRLVLEYNAQVGPKDE